jgi:DNA-binding SARP family transcriptional activator
MLQLVSRAPYQAEVEESYTESTGEACTSPVMHIHLLGTFRLSVEGLPRATVELPRLQSLLAYLALHPEVPLSRTSLASLFWPESTEAQAHTNLRNVIHKLRQSFSGAGNFIQADRHMVRWEPDTSWTLDVLIFEQAYARAEQARSKRDSAGERAFLEEVISVYLGELLPGCYDEWVFSERERLEQLYQAALERLIALHEQAGDYPAAIRVAQRLLRHDPLHEAAYRYLMRLYAASGNRAAAVRMYQNCVALLKRELGVGPSSATQALYRELFAEDESAQFTYTRPVEQRAYANALVGKA